MSFTVVCYYYYNITNPIMLTKTGPDMTNLYRKKKSDINLEEPTKRPKKMIIP